MLKSSCSGTYCVLCSYSTAYLVCSLLYPVTFAAATTPHRINNISPCLIFTVIDKPEIGLDFPFQTYSSTVLQCYCHNKIVASIIRPSRGCQLKLFTKSFPRAVVASRLACATLDNSTLFPSMLDPNTLQPLKPKRLRALGYDHP